jgi:hypothetical protein
MHHRLLIIRCAYMHDLYTIRCFSVRGIEWAYLRSCSLIPQWAISRIGVCYPWSVPQALANPTVQIPLPLVQCILDSINMTHTKNQLDWSSINQWTSWSNSPEARNWCTPSSRDRCRLVQLILRVWMCSETFLTPVQRHGNLFPQQKLYRLITPPISAAEVLKLLVHTLVLGNKAYLQ